MRKVWETKKFWCLAAFIVLILCFCAWLGRPAPVVIEAPVTAPPDLVVSVQEDSFVKPWGEGRWDYLQHNGRPGNTNKTPGMPENWWAQQPDLVTGGKTAQLSFSLQPDEVAVTRYSVTDGSYTSCELREDGTVALTEGRWTYRIMARWTDESRPYHGWAKYIVCIEKK